MPGRSGVTVFLSSHLLSEIEQVATHVAIISQGELKVEGTPEELRMRSEQIIVVEVDQPERALDLLYGIGRTVKRDNLRILIEPDGQCEPAQINAILVKAEIAVSHLATHHKTLEEVFLDLTSSPAPDAEHVAR